MTQRSTFPTLIAAGLLILALIVGVFVWQPVRENVATLADELTAEESELVALQVELADLVALEANLPMADSERERILDSVPLDLLQDELIENLDTIANEVGVSLNSVTFALQNNQGTDSNVISIVPNFTGNYSDLISLLDALENNDRLFKVASIGVQLGDSTDDVEQQMTFSVSLEAYYQ